LMEWTTWPEHPWRTHNFKNPKKRAGACQPGEDDEQGHNLAETHNQTDSCGIGGWSATPGLQLAEKCSEDVGKQSRGF